MMPVSDCHASPSRQGRSLSILVTVDRDAAGGLEYRGPATMTGSLASVEGGVRDACQLKGCFSLLSRQPRLPSVQSSMSSAL